MDRFFADDCLSNTVCMGKPFAVAYTVPSYAQVHQTTIVHACELSVAG